MVETVWSLAVRWLGPDRLALRPAPKTRPCHAHATTPQCRANVDVGPAATSPRETRWAALGGREQGALRSKARMHASWPFSRAGQSTSCAVSCLARVLVHTASATPVSDHGQEQAAERPASGRVRSVAESGGRWLHTTPQRRHHTHHHHHRHLRPHSSRQRRAVARSCASSGRSSSMPVPVPVPARWRR